MVFWVYILKCWNESEEKCTFYTGFTNDLGRRLKEHKREGYTKRFPKIEYVYYEKVNTKSEARQRELFIKKQTREWKLTLIKKGQNRKIYQNFRR